MKRILGGAGVVVLASLIGLWALPSARVEGITGVWQADVDLPDGGGTVTFGFEQRGETLRGAYRGSYGTANLTGTVVNDRIEFAFETARTGRVAFRGTLDGRTLRGTCDYGDAGGVGTWTAQRGRGSLFDD